MSRQGNTLLSDWKVFVDGVEIPHQGFTVEFSQNQLSTCSITAEPDDALIKNIRPDSLVHVFVRKQTDAQLYLYWEGLLKEISHSKSPVSRYLQLNCSCLLSVFQETLAFMIGLGPVTHSAIFSGSIENPDLVSSSLNADGLDYLSLSTLSQLMLDEVSETEYSDALLKLITYLSSHNGVLRQRVVRTRLLNKLSSIPDTVLKNLLPKKLALNAFANAQNELSQSSSILDILNHINSYVFYKFSHVPAPAKPKKQPTKNFVFQPISQNTDDINERFNIGASFFRQDFVFHPDLSFALPPPCNILFPDVVDSFSISKSFTQIPTRLLVPDVFVSSSNIDPFYWLAPKHLSRALTRAEAAATDPAHLFSLAASLIKQDNLADAPKSAYYFKISDSSSGNLLGYVTDAELEKGIFTQIEDATYETLAASGFVKSENISDDIASDANRLYSQFMSTVAAYKLNKARFNRPASVQLIGNYWVVPGFSALLCDRDTSYMVYITGLSTRVDPEGMTTTQLAVEYPRAIKEINSNKLFSFLSQFQQVATDIQKTGEATLLAAAIKDSWQVTKLFVDSISENLPTAIEELQASEANNTGIGDNTRSLLTRLAELFTTFRKDGVDLVDKLIRSSATSGLTINYDPNSKITTVRSNTGSHTTRLFPFSMDMIYYLFVGSKFSSSESAIAQYNTRFYLSGYNVAFDIDTVSNRLNSVDETNLANYINFLVVLNDYVGEMKLAYFGWLETQEEILSSGADKSSLGPIPSLVEKQLQTSLSSLASFSRARLVRDTELAAAKLVDELELSDDAAIPPPFFNENLLSLKKLDETYSDLLGCKKLYTGPFSKETGSSSSDISKVFKTAGIDIDKEDLPSVRRLLYYAQFYKGLEILNAIYPIFSNRSRTGLKIKDWVAKSIENSNDSCLRWEIDSFLDRDIVSIQEFAKDHNLSISESFSDSVVPTKFIWLAPKELATKVGSLFWDNSLFSKVVDDRYLTTGLETDPYIRQVRKSATNPFLTTRGRQGIILQYSRKHFGSRAFDGS